MSVSLKKWLLTLMVKGGIWNKVFALKEVLWLDSITMGVFFGFFFNKPYFFK